MLHDGAGLGAEGLAVPVHLVGDLGEVVALEGAGEDGGGLALGGLGLVEGLDELVDVVAVDHDAVEAEGLDAGLVGLHVVGKGGGVRLAEPEKIMFCFIFGEISFAKPENESVFDFQLLSNLLTVLQMHFLKLKKKACIPVDVNDGDEVVELVEPGEGHGLPDVALHGLAVSHEAVGPVGGLVNVLANVGHATGNGQTLKSRTRSVSHFQSFLV